MITYEKQIKNLQDMIKVQCSPGNFDCNPYMHGLANGLLLAMSCFTDEEPKFLAAPVKWLDDQQLDELKVIE